MDAVVLRDLIAGDFRVSVLVGGAVADTHYSNGLLITATEAVSDSSGGALLIVLS